MHTAPLRCPECGQKVLPVRTRDEAQKYLRCPICQTEFDNDLLAIGY